MAEQLLTGGDDRGHCDEDDQGRIHGEHQVGSPSTAGCATDATILVAAPGKIGKGDVPFFIELIGHCYESLVRHAVWILPPGSKDLAHDYAADAILRAAHNLACRMSEEFFQVLSKVVLSMPPDDREKDLEKLVDEMRKITGVTVSRSAMEDAVDEINARLARP